jgi:hypothetical protein
MCCKEVLTKCTKKGGCVMIISITPVKLFAVAGILSTTLFAGQAAADGTESLGPPSIAIETGTGIVAAGTGTLTQPGMMTIDVPAGASVKQALLYWEGFMSTNVDGDNTIIVNGAELTGDKIGGVTFFWNPAYTSTFRRDITDLISSGTNNLAIEGLNFTNVSNGAGVLVIYDDGSDTADIQVLDGNDPAGSDSSGQFPGARGVTVAQTFMFSSVDADRTGDLRMFFSSVSGSASTGGQRPNSIEVTSGGVTNIYSNLLDSNDDDEWDTVTLPVAIPAFANSVTVQAFSRDDEATGNIPASMVWSAAGLAVPPLDTPPFVSGRMTGGGNQVRVDGVRVTRGFTIHCDIKLSNNLEINWPGGNKWHLNKPITSAECIDDPNVSPLPPAAPFDTFIGEGEGKLNGVDGSIVRFVFVDKGEPGRNVDTAMIKVWAPGDDPDADTPVLEVEGTLDGGNIQAHYDQPHK